MLFSINLNAQHVNGMTLKFNWLKYLNVELYGY